MSLYELIKDIEREFQKSKNSTAHFMHIHEVKSFIERREEDLIRFKKLVGCYDLSENILTVHKDLRKRFPDEAKFFGGISLKGREYFALTTKVKEAITKKERHFYKKEVELEDELSSSYAIPDELDDEQFEKLYGKNITG